MRNKMKSAEEIAKELISEIAKLSFKLFRNKKFRKLVELESFDQVEQDRIFNEIIISAIVLGDLFYGSVLEEPQNNKEFFLELKTEFLSGYGNMLIDIGSDKKDADLFKKVILIRVEEYQKIYKKDKKNLPEYKPLAWPFVVAIGGYDHIKRGKGNPEDPLFQLFLDWIKQIYKLILKIR